MRTGPTSRKSATKPAAKTKRVQDKPAAAVGEPDNREFALVKYSPSIGEHYIDEEGNVAAQGPVRFPTGKAMQLAAKHGARMVGH